MNFNIAADTYRAEFVVVTPDLAEQWLTKNTHNRNSRQRVIDGYATDMMAGNWKDNGAAIVFAKDGTLLDGQHRLFAILQAEVTVRMLVVRGAEKDAQDTIDGGAKRKLSDVLHLRGEAHYTALAAGLRRITAYELVGDNAGGWSYTPTTQQSLGTLEKYSWLREFAPRTGPLSRRGVPSSVAIYLWFRFSQIDGDDADYFFKVIEDRAPLTDGDPIHVLLRALDNSVSVRGARNARWITALCIKAWNKYRAGESVKNLSWRPGGAAAEAFPEPK
ncbi:hypothetical protein [Promicromonospora aerolata]|uniref:DGQHR domain-containing protein n=1 Tax=Promicromonospora aerolata TaxID=195749 RepID=A0ABW4V4P2_9MICO